MDLKAVGDLMALFLTVYSLLVPKINLTLAITLCPNSNSNINPRVLTS